MNKKLSLTLLLFTLAGALWFVSRRTHRFGQHTPARGATHTMTIFIHGTFNASLGLLNVYDLFSDNVQSSEYARIVSAMRDDEFFHQEQAMLGLGLHSFEPTFVVPEGEYKRAAYPIAGAYEEVTQALAPGSTINHYYTFGWSGLLSAQARLAAAGELGKALTDEYRALVTQGITPTIRIITHSHGGNVALNLATLALDDLPHIDELVLLGTPVQEETSALVHEELFGTIYNLYSLQDAAQGADFISTKNHHSERRFELEEEGKVVQAQLLVNHDPAAEVAEQPRSIWAKLFGRGPSESCDPSHKDLWFLTWNNEYCQPNFPFKPLPMVMFVPLVLSVLQGQHDAQVNVCVRDGYVSARVLGSETMQRIPLTLFEEIKQHVLLWQPQRLSKQAAFEKLLARR